MEKLFKQIMSFKAMTAVLKENEILYYSFTVIIKWL